jgi:hypothetical protein
MTTPHTISAESKAYLKRPQKLGDKELSNCRFQFKKRPQSLPSVYCISMNGFIKFPVWGHSTSSHAAITAKMYEQASPRIAKQETESSILWDIMPRSSVKVTQDRTLHNHRCEDPVPPFEANIR